VSETLEELKAIVDNAEESDLFFDGRYLNSKLHARHHVKKYHQGGISENIYYDAPLYVDTKKLRSLSDIKLIIDLIEASSKTKERYIRNIERQRRYIEP